MLFCLMVDSVFAVSFAVKPEWNETACGLAVRRLRGYVTESVSSSISG